jgi:hypothetical protein
MNGFYKESKFMADYPEEINDSLLIDRSVAETAKADGGSIEDGFGHRARRP